MTEQIFPSKRVGRLWQEHWCGTCFQPDEAARRLFDRGGGCPILAQALGGAVPAEWKSRPDRGSKPGALDVYSCGRYRDRPAIYRRPRAKATGIQQSLFGDLEPAERALVPIAGWPDYAALERAGNASGTA
jgi:hypothetical protein